MKGIIFSTDEVQAILQERKSQHRLPIKNIEGMDFLGCGIEPKEISGKAAFGHGSFETILDSKIEKYVKPPYKEGDMLYCKETWANIENFNNYYNLEIDEDLQYLYKCDDNGCKHPFIEVAITKWRSPAHMKKEASRIFLKVTAVRVQRLQDITEEEAKAEGISWERAYECNDWCPTYNDPDSGGSPDYLAAYESEWDNKHKNYLWNENPYVWVIDFKRIEKKLIGNDSQKCCNNCNYLNHDYYNCKGEKDLNSKCHEYTLSKERVIEFEK